jgi:hypothetical protein
LEHGKERSQQRKQEAGPGLVLLRNYITMGKVEDDVMHSWNSPTQQHVQSFYMDETRSYKYVS